MTVDALVVGAGPVGMTAAMLLQGQGLSVRIVERRTGPQRAPAAHVVNARTFEIWRQLGLDVDAIRAAAQTPEEAGTVFWVESLGGEVYGSLPYEQQGDDQYAVTPTPLRNISQHVLEPMLAAEAAKRGIEIEYGVEWAPGFMDGDHRWLLGCDGAGSAVRRSIGVQMVGPTNLQRFAMIHFRADLEGLLDGHRGVLYWICGPAKGTFVSHGNGGEWVYMSPLDPEEAEPSAAEALRRIRAAMGDRPAEIELLSQSSWTMTSQIASAYRVGGTFLVGDAAHRFPPSGGMGLNSGVADAHNLVWKIAAVMHGEAGDELLDTYEPERRPIAERNAQASLENAFRMLEVFVALATDDRDALQVAIANQATHFDMLGLQIGYHYPRAGESHPPLTEEVIRRYVPTVTPGSRLPHGWLRRDGERISSLDLVPLGRSVVIAGPSYAGEADVVIGRDVEDPDGWWAGTLGLAPTASVTVRPDQHIA